MTIWQPGMRCVCVNDQPKTGAFLREVAAHGFEPSLPKRGGIYTVRSVRDWPLVSLLTFDELNNEHIIGPLSRIEPGFSAHNFCPISETRLDQFRAHLAPTPGQQVPA